jgi:hypothetical protein
MKKKSWATFERVFKKKDDHHHRHSTVPRRSKMSGSGESGKSVKSRGTRHSVAVSHSTIDSGAAEEDPGDQVLQYERIMAQKVCSFSGLFSFTITYFLKRSKIVMIFKRQSLLKLIGFMYGCEIPSQALNLCANGCQLTQRFSS